jgi:hypothetical protein
MLGIEFFPADEVLIVLAVVEDIESAKNMERIIAYRYCRNYNSLLYEAKKSSSYLFVDD